jgi:hypothetical protein
MCSRLGGVVTSGLGIQSLPHHSNSSPVSRAFFSGGQTRYRMTSKPPLFAPFSPLSPSFRDTNDRRCLSIPRSKLEFSPEVIDRVGPLYWLLPSSELKISIHHLNLPERSNFEGSKQPSLDSMNLIRVVFILKDFSYGWTK